MILHLYTQDKCGWCSKLEKTLVDWGFEYELFNISHDPTAKEFMKKEGHKTVPKWFLVEAFAAPLRVSRLAGQIHQGGRLI